MRIKKSLSVFLLIISVMFANAQGTSKCEAAFATYEASVKSGDYDGALSQFKDLKDKCPKVSDKLYLYAEAVLNSKIDAARTTEERKVYINDLASLYTQFDKNFPGNKNSNEIKKALLLNEYKMIPESEVFAILDASFKSNRQNFTNYKALELYFNLYLKKYEEGKSGVSDKDFISSYNDISGQLIFAKNKLSAQRNELLKKQETQMLTDEEKQFVADAAQEIDVFTAIGENADIQASKHFTCEKLEQYYNEGYEKHKADAAWLEAMVNTMFNNKCLRSPLLQQGATALFELQPTTETALRLGSLAQKRNDLKEAIKYFELAAGMENSSESKASLYYRIAGIFRNSDKKEAKSYALKATQLNPKFGKPYVFLAEMYSSVSSECDVNAFDRKALLWLAIETVKKAEVAEPKYKATVESVIKSYEKRLPTKSEAKAAGKKKGDQIVYGCWINETVTVPNI